MSRGNHARGKITINIPGEVKPVILLDLATCSESTGVTTRTFRNHIKAGRIPAVKLSHCWYISATNLRAFLNGARGRKRKVDPPEYEDQYEDEPDIWIE